jgi:uncharacterized protein
MGDTARISALIICLAATLTLGGGAAAAAGDDLYQAQTVVTGQGEESRGVGFADCLQQVLVKVSGDPRLGGDPRVAALARQAATLVAAFDYRDRMAGIPVHDEQGTRDRPYDLTVSFEPAKVDAALRSLGREPWRGPRPRVAVLLGVRLGTATYVLASDGARGRDQRDALAAAAGWFGLPLALPDEAAVAAAGSSFQGLSAEAPPSLDAAVRALGADLALVGTLDWSEQALGWIASWRLDADGESFQWQISGVGFDDAFRNAMAGTAQILSGHGQPDQGGP